MLLAIAHAPMFGWAKPVPVIKERLAQPAPRHDPGRARRAGDELPARASSATMILGVTLAMSDGQPTGALEFVARNAINFLLINIFLAVFNLIPLAAVRRRPCRRRAAAAVAGPAVRGARPLRAAGPHLPAPDPADDLARARTSSARLISPIVEAIARATSSGSPARPADHAPRLDHPRQAGRARLDPGGRARSSARCAKPASPRPRSAMAARSTRWRAACCRSRSARRPSSPAGCSTRPRPTTSPSASARRPTRSTSKGKVVATSDVRPTLAEVEAVLPRFTGPIEQVPPALFGAEDRRQARLRPGAGGRGGRAEAARR